MQPIIDHIQITVRDMAVAIPFYDKLLPLLGFDPDARATAVIDAHDFQVVEYSHPRLALAITSPRSAFAQERVHRRRPGALHHLAFQAASRAEVDRLYAELQAIGAVIVAPPREYPEYTPAGYYAVFFKDLEGIKYEIVTHVRAGSAGQGAEGELEPPKRAQDYAEVRDWPGYFGAVRGLGPRETLVAALDAFEREGFARGVAVDLAAGEGRDTLELLQRGWRVLATDGHADAFSHLWPRVPQTSRPHLTTVVASFADTTLPDCDLVNASFALPFSEPRHFPELWNRIVTAIRPGGRFAGQFFGDRDSWASRPDRTHQCRDEVLKLLERFEVEMMSEEEEDDAPEVRNPKHWHLFHVVAKKHGRQ
jgi:catechol 2,3-dioxygenase-like lactoylglutathione lyase family enzyme